MQYYITDLITCVIRLVDAFVIFYRCMLVRSRTTVALLSSSSSLPRCHHGALGQGALPQLHDRLNHRAADVAAGENVPGLKHALQRDAHGRRHDDQGTCGVVPVQTGR